MNLHYWTARMASGTTPAFPRYEVDENPAPLLALALGAQCAVLAVAPTALFPIILSRSVGASAEFSDWAVFAMLVISGAATIVQAFRFGPMGSGLVIIPFPNPTAIPFCILAIQQGGTATLAALIVVSGAFQILVSWRMALLRRIITPAFSGAVLILLLLSLVPVIFRNLGDIPSDAPAFAGPACIFATFMVMAGLLIKGSANWRVWATIIGIVVGSVIALATGIYDFEPVASAPAVGLPLDGWNGLAFAFGPAFWSLLPVFLFLATVSVLQGNSLILATQRLSWRTPRAMDYRRVQGATITTSLSNALAGLAAVMPVTISPRGAAFTQQTGCASRYVGVIVGALMILAAFFPKTWSLLLGIPAPVVAIYILVLVSPLIVEGMKLIIQDAPDYRISLVVGAAIVAGLGFQTGLISLPLPDVWEAVLQNALTTGGVILVLLTAFAEFGRRRRQRVQVKLHMDELPKLEQFMERYASRGGWSEPMRARLQAAVEETMLILLDGGEGDDNQPPKRLVLDVASAGAAVDLEFKSAVGGSENLEDRIALLSQQMPAGTELGLQELETAVERDAPLRLLRHYATSVSHSQYFDVEIITVRVTSPTA